MIQFISLGVVILLIVIMILMIRKMRKDGEESMKRFKEKVIIISDPGDEVDDHIYQNLYDYQRRKREVE